MDRRFLVILAIVILGLGGLFIFTRDKASAPGNGSTTTDTKKGSNHVKGENSKKVSLLVYGDFECSACAQMYPIEQQVFQKYSAEISFTFRHFPLETIHPNARAASRAAEAAGSQGKFFEMHDYLYENQSSWVGQKDPLNIFTQFAVAIGLDIEKFKTDFASEEINSIINADSSKGKQDGVDGTPTYFINGKKLNNLDVSSVDKFSAKVEEAIKAASKQAN